MDTEVLTTLLEMLKVDLGLMSPPAAVVEYMTQLLEASRSQITGRGVSLDMSQTADLLFVASWAAWLYRRRDSGSGLPEMLLAELRSRLVRQAAAAEDEEADEA